MTADPMPTNGRRLSRRGKFTGVPVPTATGSAFGEPGDIVEVVGRHVALAPHGDHQLRGDCPFCGSTAPAFIVRPDHGTFHCLSCGEGGNAARFAAAIDR
ncbi:CHC2 zinc finger domain-containing protein [Amycolatopsis australiensis]|uniref:CHC2 zinc finger n=1 Tax=Amycolatopsis australiensis TaxID=546364 RepID=A0A1K1SVL4_9PSEU|nr:CHC2 zinc finger domain-containing protein [Amycolatopsis australiensis]SFW88342.1 CHC2 zinc finger [Amycolatopsis australiensis]